MKLVIKVGTQSILSADGTPCEEIMLHLVEQIVALQTAGHAILLVSSGAVASGRRLAGQFLGRHYGASTGEKQVLASLGQYELMHAYATMLKKHRLLASQLLLTKHDFQSRHHYLNIARLLNELLAHKNIVPIINENDSVAIEELMFTDNDELAGLIAAQVNADKLIILSNVEGVYEGHPNEPGSQLIPIIHAGNWPEVSSQRSAQGRGGMRSKLNTARHLANLGIPTHIAHVKQPAILTRLVNHEAIGTLILPSKKKSNIKRWIAYSEQTMGSVTVNACLNQMIQDKTRVFSILPIGIASCVGNFKKGDLVAILTPNQTQIAVGLARYDALKLKDYIGQPGCPAFIHYDYLHIF